MAMMQRPCPDAFTPGCYVLAPLHLDSRSYECCFKLPASFCIGCMQHVHAEPHLVGDISVFRIVPAFFWQSRHTKFEDRKIVERTHPACETLQACNDDGLKIKRCCRSHEIVDDAVLMWGWQVYSSREGCNQAVEVIPRAGRWGPKCIKFNCMPSRCGRRSGLDRPDGPYGRRSGL